MVSFVENYVSKPGKPYPLGSTFDGIGTNFAVFSDVASKVELCIFDQRGKEVRLNVTQCDNFVWHIYIEPLPPGTRYGYRVYGPNDEYGNKCNESKLLLDPYAKAISGMIDGDESLYDYYFDAKKEGELNKLDSAAHTMKSVVISPYFDWENDARPEYEYSGTVIYEAHVKGMTMQHPKIPKHLRGRYLGLAHPDMVEYFKNLGVTAIELMPIHQFVNDPSLVEKNLSNYWGYNTIGFFAPHNGYASGDGGEQVSEFKQMVKILHKNDIEVIIDVVYNHTAEGNHKGPTLSFKGLDNNNYYRLVEDNKNYYFDTTGTGNSLKMNSPHTLQLIMDSLRYWVQEMHVDGFRFDLAATLARQFHDVDKLSAFFDIIHQDPIISQVKLIAEPWDLGDGGYQVGGFPNLWSEWNGRYRDSIRDFWRSEDGSLNEFTTRITGSSDLYEYSGRKPVASVNFVTAHDGFTMHDLVSYNDKHNEANGEGNADGETHNRSWNCGKEGETDDLQIRNLRTRQMKNFMCSLFLSLGIPMIAHGDEIMRTQHGNNNVYCQDNALAWVDWNLNEEQKEMLDFTSKLIKYRLRHPVLHRSNYFSSQGEAVWFSHQAKAMSADDWSNFFAKTIMLYLDGTKMNSIDEHGTPVVDDSFLIVFNGHYEEMTFRLPRIDDVKEYELVIDTMLGTDAFIDDDERFPVLPENEIIVAARSIRMYKAINTQQASHN
ncbi:MAG: glycogen debranching protein GlgX [Candidatus Ancillula sp.]|nr:glycogen debranching protein GlgX [Candidatus Ancillula sp.]